MLEWITGSLLAALSATLAFWFACGTVGMGLLTWRYRGRFAHWRHLSARDRADAILNLSLFGILFNAAYQRSGAAFAFALREWEVNRVTLLTAPFYLPWSLLFMAGFLWWMCFETFGERHHRLAWLALIGAGAWLGFAVWHHF